MERLTITSQLQHLQSKYSGTGNADTTKEDWGLTIHRDTLASHVGHYSRLAYFAVAENDCVKRIRHRCLQEMVRPCVREDAPSANAASGNSSRTSRPDTSTTLKTEASATVVDTADDEDAMQEE